MQTNIKNAHKVLVSYSGKFSGIKGIISKGIRKKKSSEPQTKNPVLACLPKLDNRQ